MDKKGKIVRSLEEMRLFSENFLHTLIIQPRKEQATIVGLSGNLGAGKTAFVKCVATILGITDVITSPTFVLEKIYSIPNGSLLKKSFSKLVHIDAYRLHSGDEMSALGWNDICAEPLNIVFIEWPEQVASAMPKDMIKISFEYVDDTTRNIRF